MFTQFEDIDAREAFPCWDEPEFKIPWQLTLHVPKDLVAVSNTPIEHHERTDGWQTVKFSESPPMPSYLVALAVGPMDYVPIEGMSVPGGIYTPKGQSHLTALAIDATPGILRRLEEYFDEPYPYKKLDFIAIPEYWFGAMENPGAVTFLDNLLLLDSDSAGVGDRSTLVRVIAHELAHMWFGDLVTMRWWDDLWLNESFADWLGDKVADELYPQYEIAANELGIILAVMDIDSLPSSPPIRRVIKSTDDVTLGLGTAYNKGKSVLAMFEQYVGKENFRRGVLKHIDRNRWGNATSEDLWQALTDATAPGLADAIQTFITQSGLPLVRFEKTGDQQFRISQKQFTPFGVEADDRLWQVPVALRYSDGESEYSKMVMLTGESTVVDLIDDVAITWIFPNANQLGYYRWAMAPPAIRALPVGADGSLTAPERIGMLSNIEALMNAGAMDAGEYLDVLARFDSERRPSVLSEVVTRLVQVRLTFVNDDLTDSFGLYAESLLLAALEQIGIQPVDGEPEPVSALRPQLLLRLGQYANNEAVIEYARGVTEDYLELGESTDEALTEAALRVAALDGEQMLFERYKHGFENPETPRQREIFLSGMASFTNPKVLAAGLNYSLTDALRPNEVRNFMFWATRDPRSEDQVFDWALEHFAQLKEIYPENLIGSMPWLADGCSAARIEKAQEFFVKPENQGPSTDVQLARVSERVGNCVRLREREGEAAAAYLAQYTAPHQATVTE